MNAQDVLKIGHYQCQCQAGDYAANESKVIHGLEYAQDQRLDIMTFPESFLTGYYDIPEKMHKHSWRVDGPEIKNFLERTSHFSTVCIVGFNEVRGEHYYNSVIVCESGKLLGTYSKAFPCFAHHKGGRDFPVFKKKGVTFGVIICADAGYIEPCRILALKGAQIVFVPHYNYIPGAGLIDHFQKVRYDHAARAVENSVWFVRANSVTVGRDTGLGFEGVGYGDSYVMDPNGEIVVRSKRHSECFIAAEIDFTNRPDQLGRSRMSAATFGAEMLRAVDENGL